MKEGRKVVLSAEVSRRSRTNDYWVSDLVGLGLLSLVCTLAPVIYDTQHQEPRCT